MKNELNRGFAPMKKILVSVLMATMALSASAQQVTTLYFLENAPMRHTINPAFQPVSREIGRAHV